MQCSHRRLNLRFPKFLVSELVQAFLALTSRFPKDSRYVPADFWISDLNLLVEAKVSAARDFVRKAIGQILDYKYQAKLHGMEVVPAILLPALPTKDLVNLVTDLGIVLIVQKHLDEFEFITPKGVAINV